jgi:hypothetical protein
MENPGEERGYPSFRATTRVRIPPGTPTSLQINGELLCTLCLSGKLTPTGMAYLKILKANFFVKALDNHRP